MSYDVWMDADGDHIEPYFADTHPAFDTDGMAGNVMVTAQGYARCGNYTSNVSPIWARCLTAAVDTIPAYADHPDKLGLGDMAGQQGRVIAPVLAAAVEWGIEHIDELREMNPPNGWGNAEGAITFLWDIQRLCEANPLAKLAIWR